MGGHVETKNLSNGNTVKLAYWENIEPTEHGPKLQKSPWNQHKDRQGLEFYESTIQYMRNDWATKNMHAEIVGDGKSQNALLFYHQKTGTWHTADALDIDHAVQWKDHLSALKVKSMADAQMAYNDASNLRLLPSVYNRARDSADAILNKYGAQSSEWKEWVDSRLTFDHTAQYREFDPEKDSARRTKVTKTQDWTEENTRSELSFDKRVLDVWFNSELKKNFVGAANVTNPDTGNKQEVPLFRCAATGQLCTRDALDIDHAIPLEQVLKKMHEMFPEGFSKADALDAYNDVSNLRLVSRSANSSHEWELTPDGFRDDKVKEIPGEFKKFIVEDGDLKPNEREAVHKVMGEMREYHRQRMQEYFAQQSSPQQGLAQSPPVQTGPLVNQSGHPDNPLFQNIVGKIAQLDPKNEVFANQDQRDRMASALMVVAKHHGLTAIDNVAWGQGVGQGNIFVGQGDPSLGKFVWLSPKEGVSNSVEQNTQSLAKIPTPTQTQPTQNPTQQQHSY